MTEEQPPMGDEQDRQSAPEESQEIYAKPIPPHSYPLWIKLFGAFVGLVFIGSLISLPADVVAAREFRLAQKEYKQGKIPETVSLCEKILAAEPNAEHIKVLCAQARFALNSKEEDLKALKLLKGISITASSWDEMTQVMPQEYQQLFIESGKSAVKLRDGVVDQEAK